MDQKFIKLFQASQVFMGATLWSGPGDARELIELFASFLAKNNISFKSVRYKVKDATVETLKSPSSESQLVGLEIEGKWTWNPNWGFGALEAWMFYYKKQPAEIEVERGVLLTKWLGKAKCSPSLLKNYHDALEVGTCEPSSDSSYLVVMKNKGEFYTFHVSTESKEHLLNKVNDDAEELLNMKDGVFTCVSSNEQIGFYSSSIDLTDVSPQLEALKRRKGGPYQQSNSNKYNTHDLRLNRVTEKYRQCMSDLYQVDGTGEHVLRCSPAMIGRGALGQIWHPLQCIEFNLDLNNQEVQDALLNVLHAQNVLSRISMLSPDDSLELYDREQLDLANRLVFNIPGIPTVKNLNIDAAWTLDSTVMDSFVMFKTDIGKQFVRWIHTVVLNQELEAKLIPPSPSLSGSPSHRF